MSFSLGSGRVWPTSKLTLRPHSDIHVYYMQSQLEYARQLYDRIRRECKPDPDRHLHFPRVTQKETLTKYPPPPQSPSCASTASGRSQSAPTPTPCSR